VSELHKKLINIQNELVAPKNLYNSFGKYNYRNLESILQGVKPLLLEYGLSLTMSDKPLAIGDRVYIQSKAVLTDCESGETIKVKAVAREPDSRKGFDESMLTGSSSSYSRKYLLNGLFAIDDSVDSDTVLNVSQAELDAFSDLVENNQGATLYLMQKADMDKYISLSNKSAPKGSKMKFKEKLGDITLTAYNQSVDAGTQLIACIETEDKMGVMEIIEEMDVDEKKLSWMQLNPEQQKAIKALIEVNQ